MIMECSQCNREIGADWRTTPIIDLSYPDGELEKARVKFVGSIQKSLQEIADRKQGAICYECYLQIYSQSLVCPVLTTE